MTSGRGADPDREREMGSGEVGDRGESGGLGFAGWTEGGCRLGDGAGRPGGLVDSWAGRPSGGGVCVSVVCYFVSLGFG